jgi:hypothetical protein
MDLAWAPLDCVLALRISSSLDSVGFKTYLAWAATFLGAFFGLLQRQTPSIVYVFEALGIIQDTTKHI